MLPWHDPMGPGAQTGTLQDERHRRLGRFQIGPGGEGTIHRWEWLGSDWPTHPFRLIPNRHETAPDPATSLSYGAPRWRMWRNQLRWLHTVQAARQRFRITPLTAPERWLGMLLIEDEALHWLGMGGVPVGASLSGVAFFPTPALGTFPAVQSWFVQARQPRAR